MEEDIVKISLLQKELKANLTKAPTCRLIGIASGDNHDGSLECIVPGKHVLWNGLGKLLLGSDQNSAFSFLTLSYMPIDATLVGSIMITFVGFAYGAAMFKFIADQK